MRTPPQSWRVVGSCALPLFLGTCEADGGIPLGYLEDQYPGFVLGDVVPIVNNSNPTLRGMDFSLQAPHGFRPSPIVDPKQDIDCIAQECGDPADGHTRCVDWPERICRAYAPCQGKTSSGEVCLHKELWPLLPEDAELFGSLLLVAVAAGATGIGGGGLNVPMLMLWSKFDIKEGVPLSHCAVLGNAMAMLLVNVPQSHPSTNRRSLIYYELALLLLPAMVAGSSLGVMVGRVFPPALLIVLSLLLLGMTAAKTLVKGCHLAKSAQTSRRRQAQELGRSHARHGQGHQADLRLLAQPWGYNSNNNSQSSVSAGCCDTASATASGEGSRRPTFNEGHVEGNCAGDTSPPYTLRRTWSGELVTVGQKPSLAALHLRENSNSSRRDLQDAEAVAPAGDFTGQKLSWQVAVLLVVVTLGFTADTILLKEERTCSGGYWLALLALLPLLCFGILSGCWALRRLDAMGVSVRADGDVEVTAKNLILYPSVTLLIGLVAGLLGLGGGEFTVPLLLELGLPTRVASATSGLLMVLMTFSNVVHYGIAGTLTMFLGYASALSCTAFFGGLVGLFLRDTEYAKANTHLMVYLLSGLLVMAAVLLAVRGWDSLSDSSAWQFQSYCG